MHPDFEGHIPRLQKIAELCDTAAEFGVRGADGSTLALVSGVRKALYSYDIVNCDVRMPQQIAAERGILFKFRVADSREVEIPEVDLLFIDTDHWYGQLAAELANAGHKARRFIGFHDTVTSWESDLGRPGIGKAIQEFMAANPQWKVRESYDDWHGMMILENSDAVDLSDVSAA